MATTIRYGKAESSLGPFVAAVSERGLAMVEFMGHMNESTLLKRFPDAVLTEDASALRETLDYVADLIDHPEKDSGLALDLQGTDFELRVWHALRKIPTGTTAGYGDIAVRIGSPRDARAVAEACANNILAVVVPCHRVVKKDGSISGYRWGVRRKRALLERERRRTPCLVRTATHIG
jgi:AraC family transcriptional regulator of adaptative response/methylated-DNA-[protein]-cysteine methyltransferase